MADLLGILRIKDSNGNWVSVPGLKGDTGEPFKILGIYATAAALEAAVTDPGVGDVYLVGTTGAYDIYLYLADGWHNTGRYMPKGDQGDPAPAASITSAVETWLAANVDPETGYVLDRTLSQENAAAPADLVGKLKNALTEMGFNDPITLSDYTLINGSVHSNGKWYSSANQNYKSYAVPNLSYEEIVVSAQESLSAYVSFLKGEDIPTPTDGGTPNYCTGEANRHTVSANTTSTLAIPSDCTWIIITQKHQGTVYTPTDVTMHAAIPKISELESRISALEPLNSVNPYEHELENKVDVGELIIGNYVRKDNGSLANSAGYQCTDFVRILGTKLYMMVSYPSGEMTGTCFYDKDKNFIIGYGAEQLGQANTIVEIIPPDNAYYIRMSRRNTSAYKPIALYIPFSNENVDKIVEKFISLQNGDQSNPLGTIIQTGGLFGVFQKIGIIGDSLSVGGMNSIGSQTLDPDVEKRWFSWPQVLNRITGVDMYVCAAGGWNTSDWLNAYGNNPSFIQNWCFAYIIGLGENDRTVGHHVDLGTESDVSTTSREDCGATYYGNLANIILRCKEAAEKSRIFILTNPRPEGESSGYNAAVRYVANAFGQENNVYLVDLYTYAHEIYAQYIADQNYFYGGHMTAIGYRMSAYHISTYIDWIMRTYPRNFRDVQFIGGNS